ncbi:Gx transporter family protein [Oscillospiraceae bacterium NSJ-54]|uniref:Gx transporter family protein n=2 Tax=Zongyangia hominis TaxID=2763677 RepID=A0A926EA97_9FIRM|nr:Gx transporter family protein [Zongyangia hominis]
MQKHGSAAYNVAFTGLLFALAVVLAFLEGLLPTAAFLPPGVKLGLSNIITMYALFFVGGKRATAVAVLKSLFVFLTRGFTASVLSLCGGLLSLGVMLLLIRLKKVKLHYLTVSIFGAVFHNLGQIAAASLLLETALVFYYLPVIILSGIVMGVVTGITLRIVMPALDRLQHKVNET